MIFKALKSQLLFEKELMSVDKEMKKAGVKNQAKYYTPVFDEKGDFHHWMKKEKEQWVTLMNIQNCMMNGLQM